MDGPLGISILEYDEVRILRNICHDYIKIFFNGSRLKKQVSYRA